MVFNIGDKVWWDWRESGKHNPKNAVAAVVVDVQPQAIRVRTAVLVSGTDVVPSHCEP